MALGCADGVAEEVLGVVDVFSLRDRVDEEAELVEVVGVDCVWWEGGREAAEHCGW